MKILLQSLLLLVGINLIAARVLYWPDHHSKSFFDDDDLYGYPFNRHLATFSDEISTEDSSKEPLTTSQAMTMKDFERFMSNYDYDYDDDHASARIITDPIKEIRNEKADDDDNKSDNDDHKNDNDDNANSDDNESKNLNDDNDNTKEDEEEIEIVDTSNEEIPIKAMPNADESIILSKSSEESNETLIANDPEDVKKSTVIESKPIVEHDMQLDEKEIRELTALLLTLSTMEDLLKVAEEVKDEDNSQEAEKLFEQKLKEVDSFMGFFTNALDVMLEESSEVDKDTEKSENDADDNDADDKNDSKADNDNDNDSDNDNDNADDNDNDADDKSDSKADNDSDNDNDNADDNDNDNDNDNADDDNDDDDDNKPEKAASVENNNNEEADASISLEFHGIDWQSNTQHLNTNKYNIFERSTTAASQDFKPTSSPYIPETYSPSDKPNTADIIHEYVKERENLDTLQENFLSNKQNIDKDFYHIIANVDDGESLQNFGNDIAALREGIFKIKQSIDAMQDIKSKLYFHQLIKSALEEARNN